VYNFNNSYLGKSKQRRLERTEKKNISNFKKFKRWLINLAYLQIRWQISVVPLLTVLSVMSLPQRADAANTCFVNLLYGSGGGTDTNIYVMNTSTRATNVVGNLSFTTVTLAREQSTGFIYYVENAAAGSTTYRLAYWNPATATNTIVGPIVGGPAGGFFRLGLSPSGLIYAMGSSVAGTPTAIYTINTTTGVATARGTISGLAAGSGDLAFDPTDPSGQTFYVTNGGPASLYRVTLNPAGDVTGSTLVGGTTGLAATFQLGALAFGQDGNLYATGSTNGLVRIDPNTGVGTQVAPGNATNISDFATLPQPTVAGAGVGKTGPSSVPAGSPITYNITVTNDQVYNPANRQFGCTLTGVTVPDAINPPGSVVSPTYTTSGTPGPAGTYDPATGTWTGLNLAPGQSITLAITGTVSPSASGTITNTANIVLPGGLQNTSPSTTSTVNTTVVPASADLAASKSGLANSPAPGNATYTITITNKGPGAATNAIIRDQIAAGATFVSASDGGTFANGIVTWPAITINPTDANNPAVTRTVTVNLPANGTYTNTASVTSDTQDPTPNDNQSPFTTQVPGTASADIVTRKSGPTGLSAAPGNATYTIATTNNGPADATNVVIRDQIAAGATFVSASDGGTFANGVVTWPAITLTNGQTATRTITVTLPVNGSYTNTSSNTSDTPDPTPGNNNGTDPAAQVTTVVPSTTSADIVTRKSGPTGRPAPGEVSYTIATTNNGPNDATNVVIRDAIASGATFVSASDGGTFANGIVTWPAITLNNGQTVNRTITVGLPVNGSYTNTASNTSDTPDPTPANNNGNDPAAKVTTLVPSGTSADILTSQSGVTSLGTPGNVTYTITTTNNGPDAATNVVIRNLIATGATFVSASDGGTFANGIVTWPAITLNNGQTVTRTITVTLPVNGSYTNTAYTTSDSFDPNTSNNNDTSANAQLTTIVARGNPADLVTLKSGPTGLASAPSNVTYRIVTINNGPNDATNVVIRDQIAAGSTFVSASDGGTFANGVVTWPAINTIRKGDRVTRTIRVGLPVNGSYTNTASNTSDSPDPTPSNNNGSLPTARVTTVVPSATIADVATTKSGSTGNEQAPATVAYTITTVNNGPDIATNVVIRDLIATGATFVSASDGGTFAPGVVTWPAITLNRGDRVTRTVTVTLPTNGTYTNIASNTSDTPDPDPSNNDGTATTAAVITSLPGTSPRLRLVKRITNVTRNGTAISGVNFNSFISADPTNDTATGWPANLLLGVPNISAPLQSGDEIEYTIYFLSDGAAPIDNLKFCDPIPPQTTFMPDSFGSGSGIRLNLAGSARSLTNLPDTDEGAFFSSLVPPSGKFASNVCPSPNNPDGSALVNLETLSNTSGANFGFVRFRVKIN
jgi:uncharacterized repeat protein (TIGR01451 family)